MGTVKGGPKGSRGFLHLFDWNRKSRKKLFSVSPESTKQEKRTDSLPETKLQFVDEDETFGISSIKGGIDFSCASSVTDEEGNGIKAPGVVARLMGLESMPTSGIPEPYSTPLFDTRSLRDKQGLKRSPELFINEQLNPAWNRTEAYIRKPAEFRTQKMPSSPVERFQTETLPPRSAKPVSFTHHKLLSPIKTPGFISPRNAAHIMEAAAKILEPAALPVNNARAKVSSSYGPLKIREPNDSIAASQGTPRAAELARRPVESADIRYLKGQSLNRSWNGSDDSSSTFRPSPDISDTTSLDGKNKGKSISLAIQAKVNVQRREGVSRNSRNRSPVLNDVDEGKLNQPFNSQPSNQKNKQQKKASLSGGSVVLRQNNQKQNFLTGKGKVISKQSVANQQGRKNLYRDTSSGKNKTNAKLSGNSRVANRKDSSETYSMECDGFLSSYKDFPQKKRLVEGDFNSERNSCVDDTPVVRHRKRVQPNVVIDEKSKWNEDKRSDGADVVSFTFTSPLVKSESGAPPSLAVEENCDKRNIYSFDGNFQMNGFASKKLSSQGFNLITGDALSFLLEQKLRQLTSGDESSYCNYAEATSSSTSCAPVQRQEVYDNNSMSTNNTGHENQLKPRTCGGQLSVPFSNGISSTNGHVFGLSYKLQGLEEVECSSNSDARKEADPLLPSPLSVLEPSFSCETCNSSTSTASNKGSRISLHSVQAQNITSSTQKKLKEFETELELSDSASSMSLSTGTSVSSEDQQNHTKSEKHDLDYVKDHTKSEKHDLDYVKEVLNSRRTCALDLALCPLDLPLFNKLENKRGKNGRMRRKMLFDCVNESLDNRRSRFLRSGYKAWAIGEAIIMPKGLAEDVYEEISGWKGFGDCMIDELVDRDMSSYRGKWVDFEMEGFELGMEMENEVICSLIDEFVAELLHCSGVENTW